MNFPNRPRIRGRRKRKKNGDSMYKPTTIPFWADITIGDVITPTVQQPMKSEETAPKGPQINDVIIDLSDDHTPAIQTTGTSQGPQEVVEVKKKPVLNIQEKTQEKFKLKQKQSDQADKQYNENQMDMRKPKIQKIETDESKPSGTSSPVVTQTTIKEQPELIDIAKEPEEVTQPPATSTSATPETLQTPTVSQTVITLSHSTAKTIPTLSNQGNTKRAAPQVRQQQNFRKTNNYHYEANIRPANMMVGSNFPGYQNMGQDLTTVPHPLPRGVPLTFLRQQQHLGAIEPQQSIDTSNSWQPLYHFAPSAQMPWQPYQPSEQLAPPADAPVIPAPETLIPVNEVRQEPPVAVAEQHPGWEEQAEGAQRRLSAFERLGPVAQTAPPQLTINLNLETEKPVREVVGGNAPEVPVPQREEILRSTDPTVRQFLAQWPWTDAPPPRRTVSARPSKTAMLMEQEQMEEFYENDDMFIQVIVKGYPSTWSKEDVFDTLLDNLKGKSFIPCFTEFSGSECRFLVVRSRGALLALHRGGLRLRRGAVTLRLALALGQLTLQQLRFLPKAVLRQRLASAYDGERKLDLDSFTLQPDVSHFIYFPLNRPNHQMDIVELQSAVEWRFLTDLVLSNNRITTVEGFDLARAAPRLRRLDLSRNRLESFAALLDCRPLPLAALKLEGNPLCTDFTDPQRYLRAIRLLFPLIKEVDGVVLPVPGELPPIRGSYCPSGAELLVERFLEMFFPMLDRPPSERAALANLYAEDVDFSVTCRSTLQSSLVRQRFGALVGGGGGGAGAWRAAGRESLLALLASWPALLHDRGLLTADVLHHSESSTVLRIGGVAKITSQKLAVDEPTLAFGRTVLLRSDGLEYRVRHELLCWDEPSEQFARHAFSATEIPKQRLSISLETPPDEHMKESLIKIFMKLTELDRPPSERCLKEKDWNLQDALKFFTELLKLNHVDFLYTNKTTDQ